MISFVALGTGQLEDELLGAQRSRDLARRDTRREPVRRAHLGRTSPLA